MNKNILMGQFWPADAFNPNPVFGPQGVFLVKHYFTSWQRASLCSNIFAVLRNK